MVGNQRILEGYEVGPMLLTDWVFFIGATGGFVLGTGFLLAVFLRPGWVAVVLGFIGMLAAFGMYWTGFRELYASNSEVDDEG